MMASILDEEPLRLSRKSRIFSHGVYTHYPFQANTFGLPREVVAECLTGFVRARERGQRDRKMPKSFAEFIDCHFGEGIARHFMTPYNTKLWNVSPKQITAGWCKRFVPIPTVEEVVSGALGLPQEEMGYNAHFFYPRTGIGELPIGLARRVKNVEFQTSIAKIDFRRKRLFVKGEWAPYKSLINTIPLRDLLQLLEKPPARIAEAIALLQCKGLRYVDVALKTPALNDYHWSYVPEQKYPFYRVGCYSNFSPCMAPPGQSNYYVELAARGRIRLDELGPRIVSGLQDMGIVNDPRDVLFMHPRYIKHAYVIYDMNYEKHVPSILSWLEQQDIFSAGRYARWEYSSMEDAILQGIIAADKAKEVSE